MLVCTLGTQKCCGCLANGKVLSGEPLGLSPAVHPPKYHIGQLIPTEGPLLGTRSGPQHHGDLKSDDNV
jgi:hypothetical protein